MERPQLERLAELLVRRAETVAVVETSAGGRICAALTSVPGSSRWFLGGAVAYSPRAAVALLGLPTAVADAGAVSGEQAGRLAVAVRGRLGATWGLAETGIAGPGGEHRSTKPPGLCFVAVAGPDATVVRQQSTGRDDRAVNLRAFAGLALRGLLEQLDGAGAGQGEGSP